MSLRLRYVCLLKILLLPANPSRALSSCAGRIRCLRRVVMAPNWCPIRHYSYDSWRTWGSATPTEHSIFPPGTASQLVRNTRSCRNTAPKSLGNIHSFDEPVSIIRAQPAVAMKVKGSNLEKLVGISIRGPSRAIGAVPGLPR